MLIYIILALILSSVNAQSQLARTIIGQPRATAEEYLLPSNVVPFLYQLELEPNFDTDTFNGSVTISIVAQSTANSIVLHTNELEVDAASISLLDEEGNVSYTVTDTSYSNDDRQYYTITFEEELTEGEVYVLVINSFTGVLNEENDGFYLARYTDEDGVERKLATTQFEATSARRAFPCFDEPALKAEFEVTIIRNASYDSISNTPKESVTEISEGRFQDKFARTVLMSTYLVAFIVSDFTSVANLNHRVFLRPSLIADNKADYALETGIGVLNAIEEFVNVTYTLEKMDQVGLPEGYFSAGAMENWGLVTYREVYLIYANLVTASNYVQNTATIIAHEFGHQWFGNLVSPLWWSYLWLNEGFATYFEYYGASVVAEYMDLMDQIVILTVQYALRRDCTTSTRPMNQDVGSPGDISSIFDTVAYDKSGSVIRMVEGILSTEVFRRGLNIYLNKIFMDIILDSSSQLATSDRLTALSSIYGSSRENRNYLYTYIKNNWTRVASSLSTQATSLLNGLAATFTTQEQYDDLKSFGAEVGVSVNNALNTIQSNIAWADQYMPTILDWFAENVEDRG